MRIEFAEPTKRLIAERSAYRCSLPDCGQITIGPGLKSNESALTGVAAHIQSASPGGPRGTGGLNEDELKSPENGIWLCAEHARLVDANHGGAYPASLLRGYKALQETRISREMGGLLSPAGWFHELKIIKSPLFEPGSILNFGKLNLIIGDNNTGKSAICEWLSGFVNPEFLNRWRINLPKRDHLEVSLTYFSPEKKQAQFAVRIDGSINYWLNDRPVPIFPNQLSLVYLKSSMRLREEKDDATRIARQIGTTPDAVRRLVVDIEKKGSGFVRNLQFQQNADGTTCLKADVHGTIAQLSFRELSEGEQGIVLIEFAVALAGFFSKYRPAMLLLDGAIWNLDRWWFEQYSTFLSSPHHQFQTTIVIPTRNLDLSKLKWAGWQVIRLIRTKVDQQIRPVSSA